MCIRDRAMSDCNSLTTCESLAALREGVDHLERDLSKSKIAHAKAIEALTRLKSELHSRESLCSELQSKFDQLTLSSVNYLEQISNLKAETDEKLKVMERMIELKYKGEIDSLKKYLMQFETQLKENQAALRSWELRTMITGDSWTSIVSRDNETELSSRSAKSQDLQYESSKFGKPIS
eukprot:TRINITY_DN3408_c0_g1_i3.p1 TRINITY_DN3408_c0_g1~~TRINITY_DN3408_c0_g1_i3.p1  ORF type:complete len:179 (+),score=28.22 TRINITY_DN3408_c0_g1_i3:106-642(+)